MSKQIYLYCPKGVFLTNGGYIHYLTQKDNLQKKIHTRTEKNELRVELNEMV